MAATVLARVRGLAITYEDAGDPSRSAGGSGRRGVDAATPADVSFDVHAGDVVLVLGPSGSGKSTLTLALNGLIPHDIPARVDGSIEIEGLSTADSTVAELSTHVAMVFQDPDAQLVTGTLLDEVAFGPENLLAPVSDVLARMEDALRRVGLWERRHENPDRLSGGGRQRLAIAAALAMGAPLLVLDEPTANLDPVGIEEVYATLVDVIAAGDRAIVLVEHNLDAAVALATRVVVLDAAGRLVADGPVDLLRSRAAEFHDLGVWLPVSTLAALRLRDAGYPLDPLPLAPAELRAALEASPALHVNVHRGSSSEHPNGFPPRGALSEGGTTETKRSEDVNSSPAVDSPRLDSAFRLASSLNDRHSLNVRREDADPSPVAELVEASPVGATSVPLLDDLGAQRTDPLIRIRNLTLARRRTEILHGIDLDIRRGEFVAIAGANGAGKTTLLQALAGVLKPPRDAVRIDGRDVSHLSSRELTRTIGFVFQNPEHQFVAHTVAGELAYGGASAEAVDEMLSRFGLADKADVHPFLLSGGQKRRLSVGTALIAGAPILALDEPTFGQDRGRAEEILAILRDLHAAGTTVIVVTHDMQLIADHADRVVVLAEGRVAADADPHALFADDAVLTRAGLKPPPLRQALGGLTQHPELAGAVRLADLPGGAR
ncbi:ABC transporter ATP-binding protein [Microbacterium sp. ASV49]|uniref:ABC transporter ATP-binding protein n=1 Tax=Microbacterium candidum TaxID=3041922 RepID=A0ABT7MUQ2_9MICO|nr:ABC transporter ATP-binding protein [Microbacterium sp. ASV49]MDL9978173.1 ABC transporter ATP-binding protein [Microbacterium sp. ASV49]